MNHIEDENSAREMTRASSPATEGRPLHSVLEEIGIERARQVEVEGWHAEHDDNHGDGSLALAAACYAFAGGFLDRRNINLFTRENIGFPPPLRMMWPWDWKWWKPKDSRRDLVRASALIVAEIERLDRADGKSPAPQASVERQE